ncbi:MAG: S-layer homology domain-containing protein, partial [Oscillospiraceae bacterium]|nr:S-layer homology domain-containing protein [Oscillospiraceae bacterium]
MRHKFRRIIALMLAFIMSFSVLLVPAAAFSFEDVPGGVWYAQAVSYVYEKGWMLGVSDTKFAPQQELTRGMFVTVLARIADAKADNNSPAFSDTPAGKWFTGAASWAAGEGIVNGVGDGKFAPYRNITRQDLCTMVYRYLHAKGLDESLRPTQDTAFVDSAYVSVYAKDAVNFCASVGLVAGFSEKDGTLTFRPGATATRAQTAMILMRLDRLLKGESPNPEPMPAQSFSEDCGDGMRVSVNAPKGALPEGTELQVTPVTDERILSDFKAVVGGNLLAVADISFLRSGRELEPLTEVEVQMALSGLETAEAPAVYHIRKDGTPEPVEAELLSLSRAPGDAVLRFSAKDFSVYVISDTPPSTAELTVQFYGVDDQLFNTQKIRVARISNAEEGAELVYDPGLPGFGSDAGEKSFEGWYQAESAPALSSLNNVTGESVSEINSRIKAEYDGISSDTTIKFYPLVFYVARLNYYDQKGSQIATQTKRISY